MQHSVRRGFSQGFAAIKIFYLDRKRNRGGYTPGPKLKFQKASPAFHVGRKSPRAALNRSTGVETEVAAQDTVLLLGELSVLGSEAWTLKNALTLFFAFC